MSDETPVSNAVRAGAATRSRNAFNVSSRDKSPLLNGRDNIVSTTGRKTSAVDRIEPLSADVISTAGAATSKVRVNCCTRPCGPDSSARSTYLPGGS